MNRHSLTILALLFTASISLKAQQLSAVWVADLDNGKYKNPVLHADYSDPDVVKVGDDFYMTASSFNAVPGLPLLHSKDLVNWSLIGHALDRIPPYDHFSTPQHGNGVWAPAFRYHNEHFYIYWGDPDFGIYMVKSKNIEGPWDEPILVQAGKGLIDPCPLWDEDGKAYLVHAYAGSRAGIKSILVVNRMSADGTKLLDEGRIVFDGHESHPTVEGPKFYHQNGYYYILAPAGGVSTGWQLALRAKNPLGPYEEKIVMHQGETAINGPHQGGLINLDNGESWFLHFQDKEAYGRVVHLQPVTWEKNWPIIGLDTNKDGIGEPVIEHPKPKVSSKTTIITPAESDEFNADAMGLQWQWHGNPQGGWAFNYPKEGVLRLYAVQMPESATSLWSIPNLLLQKFPAPEFTATTKLSFHPNKELTDEKTGLLVMGEDYAYLSLVSKEDGVYLSYCTVENARKGATEQEELIQKIDTEDVYLRVHVSQGAICSFSFSLNGRDFKAVGDEFKAKPGRWIGAKVGLFATRKDKINDAAYADYDWFRISK